MPVLFAALSALLYGSADFAGGFASRRNSVFSVIFFSQIAGLLAALLAAPLAGPNAPAAADLAWGAAAGILGALGLGFLYHGIGRGIVAVVSPVSALTGAVVPMLFGLIAGESPSPAGWAGAALCLPSTVLLTWEGFPSGGAGGGPGASAARRSLRIGLLAGLGFGGFFIAVSRTGADAGLWPLVAARCASILAVGASALLLRRRLGVGAGARRIAISAGILDMGANIAFLLAARSGMLVVVSVVTALYPGPTVLLARIFMGQRLGPAKAAGLVLAVAGTALIGAG